MSIAYFNVSHKNTLPKLWLCKPNKQVMAPLLDIYNLELQSRLGAISELTFTIPTKIERNHVLIDNPLIDKIKDRYYVKLVYERQIEYFVFLKQNKSISNDGKSISYHLYNTAYLLNDKYIYKLEEIGWTLDLFAEKILAESSWRFDAASTDAYFLVTKRYMNIASKTILESLFELAKNYNAIILFDTIKETVSFRNPSDIGLNKGLKIKDNRFLQSLNIETKADEMITRLYVYGKEGMSINELTPTGSSYIEDFTYFMHPFECDSNYNVLKSSDYMSDGLCIAITKYRKLLQGYTGRFDALAANSTALEARVVVEQQKLSVLETELNILHDELDVINAAYGEQAEGREDHRQILENIDAKRGEIVAQELVISGVYAQLATVKASIEELSKTLSLSRNLTSTELMELNKFIITKEHTNDSIIDAKDLLVEAIEVFETLNEPPIDLSLNVEGYLESLQDGSQLQKISLGDIVRVEDADLRVNYRLKILEIHFNFDEQSINLTIANGKDVIDDNAKLIDMIYDSTNTSTIVNMDKFKWNLAITANDNVSRLLNSEWDAVKNAIMGGYNQTITISNRGLIAQDLDDPMNWLVLQNGVLAITNNGGNTWKTAMTKNGIFAERLVGKILLSNKLHVEDEEGIITIEGASLKVHDLNGMVRAELGRFKDGDDNTRYGLRIDSGAIYITNGLPKSQLDPSAVEKWDNAELNAKDYAKKLYDPIEKEINELIKQLDDLDLTIDDAFRDGIIEEAEAAAIALQIELLNNEKADVDAQCTYLNTMPSLSSVLKESLNDIKRAYDNAHAGLISTINKAISDGIGEEEERQAIKTRFETYRIASASLKMIIQSCIDSIALAIVKESDEKIRTDLRLNGALPTAITMDERGITASTPYLSKFARLDYRGLYVQGGALDIRTGAASNTGVLINGQGIQGYNSSGLKTFDINATSGRVTITGSFTIQGGGTGNSIIINESGIYAYAGGAQNVAITSNGDAYFSGTVEAASIYASEIDGSSITASEIVSSSMSASKIKGTTIEGGTITGSVIQTSKETATGLKINATGLHLYDAEGEKTVYLGVDGTATFKGDIKGSKITGSKIDVDEDVRIGNNLYLGTEENRYQEKTIYFNNDSYIVGGTGVVSQALMLYSNDEIYFSSPTFRFSQQAKILFEGTTVDFTGAEVEGIETVARFG